MFEARDATQGLPIRAIAWYCLRNCSIHRGKGIVNSVLGKFLCVKIRRIEIRILNPLEYHQHALLESSLWARCAAQCVEVDRV